MNQPQHLPETGFLRLSQIIGRSAVTEEDAAEIKAATEKTVRVKDAITPLVPVSKTTWWQGVRDGKFPKPLKLGKRTTVWRAEDIRALITRAAA